MKAATILSLGLAFSLSSVFTFGSSLVHASTVTGQLTAGSSAPSPGSGSEVSGTLGGGDVAVNTISGTVSGGSSGSSSGGSSGGGGGGNGSISSMARSSGSSGGGSSGGSIGETSGSGPGSVLGASTDVSNVPPIVSNPTEGSLTDQGGIALGTGNGLTAQGNVPFTAAVAASGFGISWLLWLLLLLLLVTASIYTYRRYYR
ncbi:MAG: hypothetical protein ACYC6X_03395 [Minisyncoccota bacterium]